MRVGVVQMDCAVGDVAQNVKKMHEFIKRGADRGCQLVVFPEMSDTGYVMSTILDTASSWDTGPVEALREAAGTSGVHVVAGVSERVDGTVFNSVVSVDNGGSIVAKYRKTHLITAAPVFEDRYLGSGDRLVTSCVAGARVGFMTCYDVRFPEVSRNLMLAGAHILILPSAFPLMRTTHWNVLTQARATENQVYLVAANRIGTDGPGLTFCGNSRVIDPYGTVVAAASEIDETILVCDIDLENIERTRGRMQIMRDRRPHLYAREVER